MYFPCKQDKNHIYPPNIPQIKEDSFDSADGRRILCHLLRGCGLLLVARLFGLEAAARSIRKNRKQKYGILYDVDHTVMWCIYSH